MSIQDLFRSEPGEGRAMEAVQRLSAVKRWHMVDTTRVQTLAEHSANVAMLAGLIARTCPGMYFGPSPYVTASALVHDLEEVFTGDIPSLTKPLLRGVKELEDSVLPMEFRFDPPPVETQELIKFCDLADGIRFIEIYGIGETAKWAATGLRQQIRRRMASAADHWPREVFTHVNRQLDLYVGK
jgi:hypothetical protein